MTYTEVKDKVNSMVASPDTMAEAAIGLLKDLEGDYTSAENLKAENARLTERIKTLQDTNQRLFLMQTGQTSTGTAGEDKDLTPLEEVDKFINDLAKA